ncbi:hypothetical protein ACQ4PT_067382 [Festuca glaucescens]
MRARSELRRAASVCSRSAGAVRALPALESASAAAKRPAAATGSPAGGHGVDAAQWIWREERGRSWGSPDFSGSGGGGGEEAAARGSAIYQGEVQDPLDRRGLYGEGILKHSLGVEFQEGIIIWHIGTEAFLTKSERAKAKGAAEHVHAIRVLSDYMMFLLVDGPYMLPGQPQKRLYQRICEKLVGMRSLHSKYLNDLHSGMARNLFRVYDGPNSRTSRVAETEELANILYDEYENREFSHTAPRLTHAARLAKELLEKERSGMPDSLELVLEVWMDIIVYAGNKCSRNSHAQKLNSGGEMTTILWLMAEHLHRRSAP